MKQFKKRTLALVLASVVTVVGSFAETYYKNSLMALDFKSNSAGKVDVLLQTKRLYDGNLNLVRKTVDTYVLTLPEVDSKASSPSLSGSMGNIRSVDIRTMPYSNTSKGYTRITIKTEPSVQLLPKNEVYLPKNDASAPKAIATEVKPPVNTRVNSPNQPQQVNRTVQTQNNEAYRAELLRKQQQVAKQNIIEEDLDPDEIKQEESASKKSNAITMTSLSDRSTSGENNTLLYILGGLIAFFSIIYFYIKAKNKLQEITGENFDIDVSDEDKKVSKKTEIKKTIKKLDSQYPSPSRTYVNSVSTLNMAAMQPEDAEEPINVVDLDELFQQVKSEDNIQEEFEIVDEENDALEAFLSGFSFEEEEEEAIVEEETPAFDEEFLEQLLNTEDFKFSKTDVDCINKLLNSEINDETIRNITEYAVSNPIKAEPNKQKILEDLVTTYAISQDVIFNDNDLKILEKLISVELDADFVTDLRVNKEKTKEMEEDINKFHAESKSPKRNRVLEVKDLLPDLSEALKNQRGQAVKSDYKPQTINYHENCEVKTFSVNVDLPDLQEAINKKESYVTKPSAKEAIVDNSYEVSKLVIDLDLPDLEDALNHPEKYQKEEEVFIPSEESLLNNLNNLTFKPFYDGSQSFEVINDIEDEDVVEDVFSEAMLNQEFEQFENFEIVNEETLQVDLDVTYPEDIESLFDNENVVVEVKEDHVVTPEFEKTEELKIDKKEKPVKQEFEPVKLERNLKQTQFSREGNNLSQDLMKKIQARRESLSKTSKIVEKSQKQQVVKEENVEQIKCIIEDESFTVISTTSFTETQGCHLAKKEDGYAVIAYDNEKIFKLKTYPELKSEKIQSRVSETFENGNKRFLVRIGLKKFIVDVSKGGIKFVMDLC